MIENLSVDIKQNIESSSIALGKGREELVKKAWKRAHRKVIGSKLEAPDGEVAERRRSRRFPIACEVRYTTVSSRTEPIAGKGKTLNISSSGMLFTSEYEIPLGTAVAVSMDWPVRLNDGCFLNLLARGRVTRCAKGQLALQFVQHEFRTQSRRDKEERAGRSVRHIGR